MGIVKRKPDSQKKTDKQETMRSPTAHGDRYTHPNGRTLIYRKSENESVGGPGIYAHPPNGRLSISIYKFAAREISLLKTSGP